jgi:chorismate mutase
MTSSVASSAPSAIGSIGEGREAIDGIDQRLRDLLAERREISAQIQRLRAAEGGPRIEHGRENAIITAWSERLGPAGVDIAMAVLALCRGSLG